MLPQASSSTSGSCQASTTPVAVRSMARLAAPSATATPRSLHTVPRPFAFHSAKRAASGAEAATAMSERRRGAQLQQPSSAAAVRGFELGSLTPHSLSLTQRAAARHSDDDARTQRSVEAEPGRHGRSGHEPTRPSDRCEAALCRRLDMDFAVDAAATERLTHSVEQGSAARIEQPQKVSSNALRHVRRRPCGATISLSPLACVAHCFVCACVLCAGAARWQCEAVHTGRSASSAHGSAAPPPPLSHTAATRRIAVAPLAGRVVARRRNSRIGAAAVSPQPGCVLTPPPRGTPSSPRQPPPD